MKFVKRESSQIDTKLESSLLKIMSNRENFLKYYNVLDLDRLLINTKTLLNNYDMYYKTCQDNQIDFGKFHTHFVTWHKKDLDNNELDYYRDVVYRIIENADDSDAESIITALDQRVFEQKIKETTDPDELIKLAEEYKTQEKEKYTEEDGFNIETLDFSVLSKSDGIPWVLPSLQASLGSLTAGELTLFVADTNTGKGLLVISQLVHTFKHLARNNIDKPILMFNSEGVVSEPMDRFFSNMYRTEYPEGFEEVVLNQVEVNKRFVDTYSDAAKRLWLFSMSKITTFDKLRKKVLQYKPAVVFIDIADKLAKERDVGSLTVLYDSLRGLAEEAQCPIIATSQSGNTKYFDETEGKFRYKRFLDDKDIYGAKQKSSAATTMICIGKDDDKSPIRYINVAKSKRGRPVKLTCNIFPEFSRIEESAW